MEYTALPKTFHIIYGWAEGRWHAKQLVEELVQAGFTEASKDKATVILAHSSGSFFVPPASNQQISVLIGFPVWPGKSLAWASFQKLWLDAVSSQPFYWLVKTGWNTTYLILHPILTIKEWQALHQPNPFAVIPKTAILVRNHDDTFSAPTLNELVTNKVIKLAGQHDDLWKNPKPYIKVAEEAYAKLLAQAND